MSSFGHFISEIVNYHHGNFTPVLAIWILMGVIGAVVTVFNLIDAVKDGKALRLLPDFISEERKLELRTIAKSSIRQEILRLIKMLSIVATGFTVVLSSPAITDAQRKALHIPYWTPTGVAIVLGLLTIVAITVIQAILDRHLRHTFYDRQSNEWKVERGEDVEPEEPKE